jgi:hypothetical protein
MQEEAPDELYGRQGGLPDEVIFSVLVREADHAFFQGDDAVIGYSDPVRIAAEVINNVFGLPDRFFNLS